MFPAVLGKDISQHNIPINRSQWSSITAEEYTHTQTHTRVQTHTQVIFCSRQRSHRVHNISPTFYLQWGFPAGSDSKESACNADYPGLIPGLGRSPGQGDGNTL